MLMRSLENDIRVFAARIRLKISVGVNAVGAECSASAYGIFSRDRDLGEGWEEQGRGLSIASSSPSRRSRRGRSAHTLGFALASRKIGCAGRNVFVACPRHAGTT